MTHRPALLGIAAALVATPVADLSAQSNPWYIPQQQPAIQAPAGAGYGTPGYGTGAPQVVQQVPQYGFGAGYIVQQQPAPAAVVVPPQQIAPYGQVPQPTITGTVGNPPSSVIGTQAYAAPATVPGQVSGYTTQSYAPPAYPAPTYSAPGFVQPSAQAPQPQATYAPQSAYAPQATYAPQPGYAAQQPVTIYIAPQPQAGQPTQVLGSYPPLGSDPTVPQQPVQQQTAQPRPAAPAAPAPAAAPSALYPGFAGPTTLTPGYGGYGGAYPGLTTPYPSPYGAAPYLGLPFY